MQSDEVIDQPSASVSLAVIGGLNEGAKLRENRMFEMSPTGIRFHGKMSKPQIIELLQLLKQTKNIYHMALADVITHAKAEYGMEFVASALEQLEFDLADGIKANTIALLPSSVRHAKLSSEHLYVVGNAELAGKITPEQSKEWLENAVECDLSAAELKASIEAGKVIRSDKSPRKNTLVTIEGLHFWFMSWRKQVKDVNQWDAERKRKLLEELSPIVQLAEEVRQSLEVAK